MDSDNTSIEDGGRPQPMDTMTFPSRPLAPDQLARAVIDEFVAIPDDSLALIVYPLVYSSVHPSSAALTSGKSAGALRRAPYTVLFGVQYWTDPQAALAHTSAMAGNARSPVIRFKEFQTAIPCRIISQSCFHVSEVVGRHLTRFMTRGSGYCSFDRSHRRQGFRAAALDSMSGAVVQRGCAA